MSIYQNNSSFQTAKTYLKQHEKWNDFCESKLSKINQIYEIEIGGYNPKKQNKFGNALSNEDDLDEFEQIFAQKDKGYYEYNEKKIDFDNEIENNFILKYEVEEYQECEFDQLDFSHFNFQE